MAINLREGGPPHMLLILSAIAAVCASIHGCQGDNSLQRAEPLKINASFHVVTTIPAHGQSAPLFHQIGGVALGPGGKSIFVSDRFGPSVRSFTMGGQLIREFGIEHQGPGHLRQPSRLTIVGEHIHVLDRDDPQAVVQFDLDGNYLGRRTAAVKADRPRLRLHSAQALMRYGQMLIHDRVSVPNAHARLVNEAGLLVDSLFSFHRGDAHARIASRPDQLRPVSGLETGSIGWEGAWTWAGDSIIVTVNNHDGTVSWHRVEPGGLEQIRVREIGLHPVPTPLSEPAVRRRAAEQLQVSAAEIVEVHFPRFEAQLVGTNVVAQNGDVWVTRRYGPDVRPGSFVQRRFIVPFDESTPIHEVELPQNFALLSVVDDLLLGRQFDPDTEVQSVRVYRIVLEDA